MGYRVMEFIRGVDWLGGNSGNNGCLRVIGRNWFMVDKNRLFVWGLF